MARLVSACSAGTVTQDSFLQETSFLGSPSKMYVHVFWRSLRKLPAGAGLRFVVCGGVLMSVGCFLLSLSVLYAGIKESDTGLAPPALWDLAADKQTLQSEQPLQVARWVHSSSLQWSCIVLNMRAYA